MTRKISGLQFDSSLAGLQNYRTDSFNFTVNAHVLGINQTSEWDATWPLQNTNAISSIQTNYAGIETVWRYASGAVATNYNSGQYEIETLTYYLDKNTFKVETFVINLSPGAVAIPQFFVNVRIFLYNAPF